MCVGGWVCVRGVRWGEDAVFTGIYRKPVPSASRGLIMHVVVSRAVKVNECIPNGALLVCGFLSKKLTKG